MSMRNKITVLGTDGSIFEDYASFSEPEYIENMLKEIINNIRTLEYSGVICDELASFKYDSMKDILNKINPQHIYIISILVEVYEDIMNQPFLYYTALSLYENNENIQKVEIILEEELL